MLFLLSTAFGADVTRIPDAMQGEVSLSAGQDSISGTLLETDVIVAQFKRTHTPVAFDVAFSPLRGVAVHAGFELDGSFSYTYDNARTAVLEPVDGGGTYRDTDPSDLPTVVRGGGVSGVVLGVAFAPFSEDHDKNHRVSWRLDASLRTGSKKNNYWTVRNDRRGGGPGSTELRIGAAAARRVGLSEPYVRARYHARLRTTVDVVDEQGRSATLPLKPSSIVDLRGGTEIHFTEDRLASLDLFLGATYRTPENVASGVYLPNVLESSTMIPVTHSDNLVGRGGLGLHVNAVPWLGVHGSIWGNYLFPHQQEHVYPVVSSNDAWGIGWSLGVRGTLDFDPE